MKKILSLLAAAVVFTTVFTGCNIKKDDDPDKLSVVTTFFPQYDFARAVAGDDINLTMLVKPGAETHSYDPSPSDIIKINEADLFIYIGGHNEAWVDKILNSLDNKDLKVLRLMDTVEVKEEEIVEGMQDDHDHDHDDNDTEWDEHIWTSPKNSIKMVNAIAEAISEVDNDNAEKYNKNAEEYTAKISELDREFTEISQNAQNKTLVFGDRFPFRYFADEYGFTYRAAFASCSTETEASAKTLKYLIDYINDENLSYIYYIEFSNEKIADTIAEATGAKTLLLHSAHNVTKDDFNDGITYYDIYKSNIENLKKGLNL